MRRRKEEVYEERRWQILEGALQVFATSGFMGATNQDIAEAAGINSPALIYHYFESKEDLLRAVIEAYAPPMQVLARMESLMALPPEQALTEFGRAYLRNWDDPKVSACLRVLIGEAMRFPEFADTMRDVGPPRVWRLLANYLERKMDEGVLQRADPWIAARCFVGPLHTYVVMRSVLEVADDTGVDPGALVDTNVRLFLRGLLVE